MESLNWIIPHRVFLNKRKTRFFHQPASHCYRTPETLHPSQSNSTARFAPYIPIGNFGSPALNIIISRRKGLQGSSFGNDK